jgi:hypothetical protein
MLRFLIRVLGLLLLAGGFVALIVDGTRSLAGGRLLVTTLRKGAAELFPLAYQALQSAVEQHLSAFLWDPVIATLLLTPISLAFGGVGALLIVLSHKQHEAIGYSSR